MTRFLLVCAGGALGTGARYVIAMSAGTSGTLIVNLAGSFLIALIMHIGTVTTLSPDVRIILTTGVLGGFTTYSSFNYEASNYFRQGSWLSGFGYMAATLFGCLAAGLLGLMIARAIVGR